MPDEKCLIDPQRDCLGLTKAVLLEKRIEDLEQWKKDSKKFHNDFYDWQREQIARDARLDEQLSNMSANLNKLVAWQETQRDKPGKRWDGIVEKIIWAVLAAGLAAVLARVGL